MDNLSDIAKDYLADFEVLTEARNEFEKELDNWWRVLISKHVKPALNEVNKGEPYFWDNKASPGQYQSRVTEEQDIYMQLLDPRISERGCYSLSLCVMSQPKLKRLSSQEPFVQRFNDLAAKLKINDKSGLRWEDTELATEDISILPDEPDVTIRQVRDAAVRFFRMVMEHHDATRKKAKD